VNLVNSIININLVAVANMNSVTTESPAFKGGDGVEMLINSLNFICSMAMSLLQAVVAPKPM
jgi:hypothetical protein